MQKLSALPITRYALAYDSADIVWATLEPIRQKVGPDKWAIRCPLGCLSKEGTFEYEEPPSRRDPAFMTNFRFDSAEEALAAWELYFTTQLPEHGPYGIRLA